MLAQGREAEGGGGGGRGTAVRGCRRPPAPSTQPPTRHRREVTFFAISRWGERWVGGSGRGAEARVCPLAAPKRPPRRARAPPPTASRRSFSPKHTLGASLQCCRCARRDPGCVLTLCVCVGEAGGKRKRVWGEVSFFSSFRSLLFAVFLVSRARGHSPAPSSHPPTPTPRPQPCLTCLWTASGRCCGELWQNSGGAQFSNRHSARRRPPILTASSPPLHTSTLDSCSVA